MQQENLSGKRKFNEMSTVGSSKKSCEGILGRISNTFRIKRGVDCNRDPSGSLWDVTDLSFDILRG